MKKDFNRKPGSDKFNKDGGGRSGRDGDKKPFRKESSDRPKRRDDDDRPKRSFNDDKPKRSFNKRTDGDDRPKRSFDNDRPSRSFGDNKPGNSFGKKDDIDRPKRSFDNDRPKRSFGDDKPKRSFNKRENGDDRPKRSFDNDRPKRSFGDDKPKRSVNKRDNGDDRPKRSSDNDRPKRSFSDDKPKRSFNKRDDGDDRPKRSSDNDRPKRSFGDDKPKRGFDKDGDKKDRPRKPKTFSDIMKGAFEGTPMGKELKKHKEPIVREEKPEEEKAPKKVKKAPQNSFERSVGKIRTNRGTDMEAYIEKKVGKASDEEKPKRPRKKIEDGDEQEFDIDGGEGTELMPLNKYIAHSGECSRREAAELVKQGKVKVNGELVTDPGHKVTQEDQVTVAGKKMVLQKNNIYILLNKPKGFITTTDDPEGRRTVMDLVEDAETDRIFPVGRLDRNTTGLLLMTNDGALAQKLSHPSHSVKKVYQVTLDKNLTKADFDKIATGFDLDDGPVTVDDIAILESKNEIGIEIHSGRNRIVRRIFESLGYQVEKLDRVMYAGLTKKNLPRSNWRYLTEKEIILLKHFKN